MYMRLVERTLFSHAPIHDSDDNSAQLMVSAIALLTVVYLVVALRVYCRAYLLRSMGADDWTMVAAALTLLGLTVPNFIACTHYGAGRHVWTLPKEWGSPALRVGYVAQIFYFASLGLCKASLILFVIRVTSSKTTRWVSWGLLIGVSCYSISALLLSIFPCLPVGVQWRRLAPGGEHLPGKCLDQRVTQYTLPAINILTDIVIWLLQLKMIWGIQLPRRQKASLIAIFALGGLGVLAGILRLFAIQGLVASNDTTWAALDLSIWSIIEASISIICGSAPAVKPLFSKFIPGLLGSNSKSSAHPTIETFGSGGNSKRSRPKSSISYALSSLNPLTHRGATSSTEELGLGPSTKIEGQTGNRSIAGSEECLNETESVGRHRGMKEGVKVRTEVQVQFEERV